MNMRRASRNPRECAEAKGEGDEGEKLAEGRNPRECAEAKEMPKVDYSDLSTVATRANALRQRTVRLWNTQILESQPARMR